MADGLFDDMDVEPDADVCLMTGVSVLLTNGLFDDMDIEPNADVCLMTGVSVQMADDGVERTQMLRAHDAR